MSLDIYSGTPGEEPNETLEMDIHVLKSGVTKGVGLIDPFTVLNKDSLPTLMKRKVGRLEKKLHGKPAASSKSVPPESLSAYDILQVIPPPYNLDALAKLYEKNPAHNSAVTTKAINIVGLGFEIVENPKTRLKIEELQRTKQGKEKLRRFLSGLERERISLVQQLDELNYDEEFTEIMIKVWTDVEALGNGYLEVGRTRKGEIGYVGHVPGSTMRVRASRDGFIQLTGGNNYVYFKNFGDAEAVNPLENDNNPNEILHFKKYSPNSTYYGVPDIISAYAAIMGDHFAKEYNLDFFENKAVPRYALITKGVKLTDESEQKLIEFFQKELKGKHHGTLYLPLPGGMPGSDIDAKFEAIENRPQDQSFIEYVKDSRMEVLMAHRVPPSKVGIYDDANLAVSRDADKTFKEQVCRPERRRAEKKINRLFGEFTSKFVIKFNEADIIDDDVKSRMFDRYLRTRVLKPNEVRREIGWPSDPEGDEFLPAPGTGPGRPAQSSGGVRPDRSGTASTSETNERKERGQEQDEREDN